MRYRIGEVSELFGLTKEGIRYYERKGIIQSTREGNGGARTYERNEIIRLKQLHAYKKLGFSLEEANAMTCLFTREEAETVIGGKIAELEEKERLLKESLDNLREQQQIMRDFLSGKIEVRVTPDIYFLPRVDSERMAKTANKKRELAQSHAVERAWTEAMPTVTLCARHYDENLRLVRDLFGSAVACDVARKIHLPTEGTQMIRGKLCICGYVEAPLGEPVRIAPLVTYMQENGYRLVGDVFALMRMGYCDENGQRWGVHEAYLPVEKENVNGQNQR